MSGLPRLPAALRLLRPQQWTKNAVVLAAFFFALGDPRQGVTFHLAGRALAAAFLFCLVSGAVYVFNDLRDLAQDRAHPLKRLRPLAAGEISPGAAACLGAAVGLAALAGAALVSRPFLVVLASYAVLQAAYTLLLKRFSLLDVMAIALGFVLRALAGAVALAVAISPWLLLCAFMLALFLALCKRREEKNRQDGAPEGARHVLSHYPLRLLDQLIAIVSAATIVCYAIYTLWPDTVAKFGTRNLVFTVPFVVFGIFRYLDLVYRHNRGHEPETALLTDAPLLIDLALYGATVLAVLVVWR